jgi:hypothetical protein
MNGPIAIVGGTGKEGYGLALRWAQAGETVILGSRVPGKAEEAASRIRGRVPGSSVSGGDNQAACAASNFIVLTVPFAVQAKLLVELKPSIRPGSIVVDTTVPLAASVGGRASRTLGVWQGSAAQQTAELLAPGVSVVAAFQNLSAELLNGEEPVECDVVVCGDDAAASREVRTLAGRIPGVRAIDGGKLENARILEQVTALLVGLNLRHKAHSGIRITGLPRSSYSSA